MTASTAREKLIEFLSDGKPHTMASIRAVVGPYLRPERAARRFLSTLRSRVKYDTERRGLTRRDDGAEELARDMPQAIERGRQYMLLNLLARSGATHEGRGDTALWQLPPERLPPSTGLTTGPSPNGALYPAAEGTDG